MCIRDSLQEGSLATPDLKTSRDSNIKALAAVAAISTAVSLSSRTQAFLALKTKSYDLAMKLKTLIKKGEASAEDTREVNRMLSSIGKLRGRIPGMSPIALRVSNSTLTAAVSAGAARLASTRGASAAMTSGRVVAGLLTRVLFGWVSLAVATAIELDAYYVKKYEKETG